jgi:hypothetical protein
MRTHKEIKEYALYMALEHFFSNAAEDNFPDDPMARLQALADADTPDDEEVEMFAWEPFQDYDAKWFIDEIETMVEHIERAMLWVQDGERT